MQVLESEIHFQISHIEDKVNSCARQHIKYFLSFKWVNLDMNLLNLNSLQSVFIMNYQLGYNFKLCDKMKPRNIQFVNHKCINIS